MFNWVLNILNMLIVNCQQERISWENSKQLVLNEIYAAQTYRMKNTTKTFFSIFSIFVEKIL